MIRRLVQPVFVALAFLSACGAPPATDSPPRAAAPTIPQAMTAPTRPASPSPVDPPPVVLSPREPDAPGAIEAGNAAELAAVKSALERATPRDAVQPRRDPPEPGPQHAVAPASNATETLSERDLAAVRESLPALRERMGQVIQRSFDAESFKQLLTNHPEFRKD